MYKMVNVNRPNLIHVGFTKEEKEDIIKYSGETNMKITEFIREAIFDKIRKIKNPELFTTQKGYESNDIKQVLSMVTENKEDVKKALEQLDSLIKIKGTLNGLSTMVHKPDLMEKELAIVELLKVHTSLKIQKIIELTGYSKENIYDIISNDKVFSIDIKSGGIKLHE